MSSLPLQGIRVVEFCQVASGPYCGMLLADLGADVIKIEPPQGDSMRAWPPLNQGFSENFAALNRNKRSLALDLRAAADLTIARRLAASAQVIVQNNRPGAMQRLGLGYEELAHGRPELVYCSISAFGQSGPRSRDGAFDVTMQAVTGIMSVTGESGGAPVKAGVPVTDFATGLYAALTIIACLLRVRNGGAGGHLDVSMLAASLGISALQTSEYFGTGCDPQPLGSAHPRNAPYQAYRAADAHFVLAAGNDALWRRVCEVLGEPLLADDERYSSTVRRARHQAGLTEILQTLFQRANASHWVQAFRAAGVPCEPINGFAAALADAQVQHLGLVEELALPGGARTRTVGPAVRLSARAGELRPPPQLDGDRDNILAELLLREQPQQVLQVTQHDTGWTLTLNRPANGNALSADLVEALHAALDRIDARLRAGDAVSCLAIAASGPDFCTGFDLDGLESQSDGDLLQRFVRIEQLCQRLAHAPLPVRVRAQGWVIGAGADLFAACGVRAAAPDVRFRFPGVRFGIVLGTRRLAALIGTQPAADWILEQRTVTALMARAAGLVTECPDAMAGDARPSTSSPDSVDANTRRLVLEALADTRLATTPSVARPDTRSDDLAALIASAAAPGLAARLRAYVAVLRA